MISAVRAPLLSRIIVDGDSLLLHYVPCMYDVPVCVMYLGEKWAYDDALTGSSSRRLCSVDSDHPWISFSLGRTDGRKTSSPSNLLREGASILCPYVVH